MNPIDSISFHRIRPPSGIALLELMLATAILGIALIALGISVGRCVQGLSSADSVQWAIDLARNRMTEWKVSLPKEERIQPAVFDGEQTIRQRKLAWHQEIETTEDPELMKVTLTVRWTEGGLERSRNFARLFRQTEKKPTP